MTSALMRTIEVDPSHPLADTDVQDDKTARLFSSRSKGHSLLMPSVAF